MTCALTFSVRDIAPEAYAAAPQLTARLGIEEGSGARVHAMVLDCQVRIEPQRRGYGDAEADALRALFGPRERWSHTLRPFPWMHCHTTVQGFTGSTETDLALPCSYDFDVVGSRYLHALGDGELPLVLLFSGTVFTRGGSGFAVQRVPWDAEARYRMPVAVWRRLMAAHYPDTGWLRLDHDVLGQLAGYRAQHSLTTWEETVRTLLNAAERTAVAEGERVP